MSQLQLIVFLAAFNVAVVHWLSENTRLPGHLPTWARSLLLLLLGGVLDPALEVWRNGGDFGQAAITALAAIALPLVTLFLDAISGKPAETRATTNIGKVGIVLMVLLVVGCTASFEEARGPRSIQFGAASAERCAQLDDRHALWGGIAEGSGVLAGASGLVAIPVKNEDAKTALIAGSVGAATLAATSAYVSAQAATSWARECTP